jgi:hypothetical protein
MTWREGYHRYDAAWFDENGQQFDEGRGWSLGSAGMSFVGRIKLHTYIRAYLSPLLLSLLTIPLNGPSSKEPPLCNVDGSFDMAHGVSQTIRARINLREGEGNWCL